MIEAVGYTEERQVFVRMAMNVNGEAMTGMLELSPDSAKKLAGDLTDAAVQAEKGPPK